MSHRHIDNLGRVSYIRGSAVQVSSLANEVAEYFRHGIDVRPDDVVLDVGANIGLFALSAAERARGGLRLYCFEPVPQLFRLLQQNLTTSPLLSTSTIRLMNVGLTGPDGARDVSFHYFKRLPCDTTQHIDEKREDFAAFFEARSAEWRRAGEALPLARWTGSGHLLAARCLEALSSHPWGRWVFDRFVGRVEVTASMRTLSEVVAEEGIDHVDLLKVDVEGAELHVLEGLDPSFWPHVRQVVLEGHDRGDRREAIVALLRRGGFHTIEVESSEVAADRGIRNFNLWAHRH